MLADFLKLLTRHEDVYTAPATDNRRIILYSLHLADFGLPAIPQEYQILLAEFNGITFDGTNLMGINPEGPFYDILDENLAIDTDDETLVLGFDEFDYLIWNPQSSRYQIVDIIDRVSFGEFAALEPALKRFLKI